MNKKPRVKTSREVLSYIDPSKPVKCYKNLHTKAISVQQDGIVQCHVDNIVLQEASFHVSEKGRDRVRREKSKNVHAYIKGFVVDARETDEILPFDWQSVRYNPYETDWFTDVESGRHVSDALYADIDANDGIITLGAKYK